MDSKSETPPPAASDPAVGFGAVLDCGHPGAPSNLIRGKCGTCKMISDWEEMAKTPNRKVRFLCLKMANLFRSGDLIYDTLGKSFIEWEKSLSPQSNTVLDQTNAR